MTGGEGNAHLGVFFRAADARAVARARVDDHERSLGIVDDNARGRNDSHERMVGGALIFARVGDHLVLVLEHRRLAGGLVLEPLIAALAQRVPVKRRTLDEIQTVFGPLAPEFDRRLGRRARVLKFSTGLAHAIAEAFVRSARPTLEEIGHRPRNGDRAIDGAVQVGHGDFR